MGFGADHYPGIAGTGGSGYLLVTKLGREMVSFLSDAPMYYSYFQNTVIMLSEKINDMIAPISSDFGQQVQAAFSRSLMQAGKAINHLAPKGVEVMGAAAANINGLVGTLVMILAAYFFIADREKFRRNGLKLSRTICRSRSIKLKQRCLPRWGALCWRN